MKSAARRLFVALWPDEGVRMALAQARDRWTWSATARPTPVPHLHVTLVFLGAVPANEVADLIAALPVPFEPFVLRLGRHALWRNGVAALEPVGEWPALKALQASIAERTAARFRTGSTTLSSACHAGARCRSRRRADRSRRRCLAHRRVRTDRITRWSLLDRCRLAPLTEHRIDKAAAPAAPIDRYAEIFRKVAVLA